MHRHDPGVEEVAATLDAVAANLTHLWTSALARGDPGEITRLVDAGHAVHDAVVALTADSVIATRSTGVEPT